MSRELPIKITAYDCDSINYIIMGIGKDGKKLLNPRELLSYFKKKENLQRVLVCDDSPFRYNGQKGDWRDTNRRQGIIEEFSLADMILILVNVDIREDLESACNVAKICKEKNKNLFSVCVCFGESFGSCNDILHSLYSSVIRMDNIQGLLKPWQFLTDMLEPSFIGIDFVDIVSILENQNSSYYYQFTISALEDLPDKLSEFEVSLIKNDCGDFQRNIALALMEVPPSIGLDEINDIATALHQYCGSRGASSIVWNAHFTKALNNKCARVSVLYGRDKNGKYV